MGERIRIEDTGLVGVADAGAWQILSLKNYAHHRPTGLVFRVEADPSRGPDDVMGLGDFVACRVHQREDAPEPLPEELVRLGREAICMTLHALDLVALIDPATARAKKPPEPGSAHAALTLP